MPVGGSRHYQGAGLGQVGLWGCPSCGEDNTGALEQGCVHCGAGKPAATPPAAATPPSPAVERAEQTRRPGLGTAWAERHADASLADAYESGYRDGVRAAREEAARRMPPQPTAAERPTGDARTYRTMVAALSLFRDQILVSRPEEVTTGEWLTAEDANQVIVQLTDILIQLGHAEPEVAHAV